MRTTETTKRVGKTFRRAELTQEVHLLELMFPISSAKRVN
jgi:hypothetical protein